MSFSYTLDELAALVPEATVSGDGSVVIERFITPHAMQGPTDLPLVMTASVAAALAAAPDLPVRAAVVSADLAESGHPLLDRLDAALVTHRPRVALCYLTRAFSVDLQFAPGIHEQAFVDATAEIDPTASIGPHAYVGPGCVIGAHTVVLPHVTILENSIIGSGCLFHPGARIGSRSQIGDRVIMQPNSCVGADGFSFVTEEESNFEQVLAGQLVSVEVANLLQLRVDSIGIVVIEDDVEIGASTMVDRGTLGETRIKKGTKLDNLIQIGHNNTIGENCIICAEVAMAGSCHIGNGVVIGGHVSVANNSKIGDGAVIMGGAGIVGEVEPGSVRFGAPSTEARTAFKNIANVGKIGDLRRRIRALERQVEKLSDKA